MHGDLGLRMVRLMVEGTNHTADASLQEVFIDSLDEEFMAPVVEFLNWFLAGGFGIANLHTNSRYPYPIRIRLTRRGCALLSSAAEHPLLPSVAARVLDRCPGLPSEVLSLIADSKECLEHRLLRPAIVLMGVAYELAIEHVLSKLAARGYVDQKVMTSAAGKRLNELSGAVVRVFPGRGEGAAAAAACDFADRLRSRRNDASHTRPTYGFDDTAEVEELLVSAWRHLPSLWSLYTAAGG